MFGCHVTSREHHFEKMLRLAIKLAVWQGRCFIWGKWVETVALNKSQKKIIRNLKVHPDPQHLLQHRNEQYTKDKYGQNYRLVQGRNFWHL